MPLAVTNDEVTSGSTITMSRTGQYRSFCGAFLASHQLAISPSICLSRFHVP